MRLDFPQPNPSLDGPVIRLELAGPDWVTLEVYDITGRKVATLVDRYLSGGLHTIGWTPGQTGELSPGMYFVSLVTRNGRQTRKVVVLK
jgi:hypothetical protein